MPSPFHRRVCTVALALLLLLPAAAKAAPTWLSPSTIGAPDADVRSTAAGSDAAGDVVAAWVRQSGAAPVVEVAERPAGGAFAVRPLQSQTDAVEDLSVAVNAAGAAVVAWNRGTETWAAVRDAGGAFGAAQQIAAVPGKTTFDASTAIGPDGTAVVAWSLRNSDTDNLERVYVARRVPGAGFVTVPVSTADAWNQHASVVVDDQRRTTVAWSSWDGASTNVARYRVGQPDGTFGTQQDLSATAPTGRPIFPSLGIGRNGEVVAVWSRYDGAAYKVTAGSRSAASPAFTALPPFGTSLSGSFGGEPRVVVAPDGSAVAAWRAPDTTVSAATRAPGAAFGTPQTGISAPAVSGPQLGVGPAGEAVLTWRRSDSGGVARNESAARPPGGAFGAVTTISPQRTGIGDAALSVDGLGNAFAVWPSVDAGLPAANDSVAGFAARDGSPPAVGAIGAPASATAGAPVGLSVTATDVWSPVTTAWDLGDGQGATGGTVSHAYAAPGTVEVRVTATDAAGNAATVTRALRIDAAPAPAAPAPLRTPAGGVAGTTTSGTPRAGRPAARFRVGRHGTVVRTLTVAGLPAGARVRLSCKGDGCAFRKATVRVRKATKRLRLTSRLRGATLRPGARLGLAVSAPGRLTVRVGWTMRDGKPPKRTTG